MKQSKQFTLLLLLLLLCGGLLPAQALQETEPNGSFATANPVAFSSLSATIEGSIGQNGDNDYYMVTIPRAGVFDYGVTNVPSNVEMRVLIYNANQFVIRDEYSGSGAPHFRRKLVCDPGTYYFRLMDRQDNSSSTQLYSFVLHLDTSDVYECNNSFAEASPVQVGDTVHGAINDNGDNDYYMVNIPRAGVFDYAVSNVPSNVEMRVIIYNANQFAIRDEYSGSGAPHFRRKLVCDPGTYYFRLMDRQDNSSSTQLYSFVVNFDTTDAYECNNDFPDASPIQLGDSIWGAINDNGDNDFYEVNVPRPGVFDYGVTNVPSNVEMRVLIYDANQVLQHDAYSGSGASHFRRRWVCSPGTYYFRLMDRHNNSSSTQLYAFVLNLDTTDAYECNNSFNEAKTIAICDTVFGSIGMTSDYDYYSFAGTPGQVLRYSLTNMPSNIGMSIRAYDNFQTQFYARNLNPGSPVLDSMTLPQSGPYYFVLNDNINDANNGQLYHLLLGDNCNAVGLEEAMESGAFLYPNPARGSVRLRLAARPANPAQLRMVDAQGKVVFRGEAAEVETEISLQDLSSGIYLLEIQLEADLEVLRLLKE